MEDKLVTVAIHTYERALILKGLLESEGIETYLHNVNLIQPVFSSGVRVRIKESDLPKALRLIEDLQFNNYDEPEKKEKPLSKTILVPVDFSPYSIKAVRFAFSMAEIMGGDIVLLHTYYSPYYSGSLPMTDTFAFDETNSKLIKEQSKKMHEEMDLLTARIEEEIKEGTLPKIHFICKFREGVPEEQIITYSKRHGCYMIIMGTKGKGAKDQNILGTVTADVIDRSKIPVFAFPEKTPFEGFRQIKNIGFITNFDQRDLIAFDSMVHSLKGLDYKVYFIRLKDDPEKWDEIQLSGIKEYFKKQYPEIESSYCVISGDNLIDGLNDFISERKIDIITLTSQKRNLFSRLFNPSLARKMVFHSDTPLFVLRG